MHYFEKMSSVSGSLAPRPPVGFCHWTPLGISVLQTRSLPTLEKNSAGAHGWSAGSNRNNDTK